MKIIIKIFKIFHLIVNKIKIQIFLVMKITTVLEVNKIARELQQKVSQYLNNTGEVFKALIYLNFIIILMIIKVIMKINKLLKLNNSYQVKGKLMKIMKKTKNLKMKFKLFKIFILKMLIQLEKLALINSKLL